MRTFLFGLYGVVMVGLTACTDPLVVDNSNNPDRGRVFSNADDLEQLISNTYARAHAATLGGGTVLTGGINDALQPQLLVMGMENVSTLANLRWARAAPFRAIRSAMRAAARGTWGTTATGSSGTARSAWRRWGWHG